MRSIVKECHRSRSGKLLRPTFDGGKNRNVVLTMACVVETAHEIRQTESGDAGMALVAEGLGRLPELNRWTKISRSQFDELADHAFEFTRCNCCRALRATLARCGQRKRVFALRHERVLLVWGLRKLFLNQRWFYAFAFARKARSILMQLKRAGCWAVTWKRCWTSTCGITSQLREHRRPPNWARVVRKHWRSVSGGLVCHRSRDRDATSRCQLPCAVAVPLGNEVPSSDDFRLRSHCEPTISPCFNTPVLAFVLTTTSVGREGVWTFTPGAIVWSMDLCRNRRS